MDNSILDKFQHVPISEKVKECSHILRKEVEERNGFSCGWTIFLNTDYRNSTEGRGVQISKPPVPIVTTSRWTGSIFPLLQRVLGIRSVHLLHPWLRCLCRFSQLLKHATQILLAADSTELHLWTFATSFQKGDLFRFHCVIFRIVAFPKQLSAKSRK